jgi:uncharacterized protein (DUF433 family)
MKLEDYFDFQRDDDIRLKGSRIGIESVLYEYVHREQTPEAIQRRFPTLRLEQVYATILYYLANRERVSAYLADWLNYCREAEAEADRNPPPVVLRLRERLAAARQTEGKDAAASDPQTAADPVAKTA